MQITMKETRQVGIDPATAKWYIGGVAYDVDPPTAEFCIDAGFAVESNVPELRAAGDRVFELGVDHGAELMYRAAKSSGMLSGKAIRELERFWSTMTPATLRDALNRYDMRTA